MQEHIILEANIQVLRTLLASQIGRAPGVRPILGFWQELLPILADASFDSIFFDPYPNDEAFYVDEVVHHHSVMQHAYRLLAPGGVLVYMSGGAEPHEIAADRNEALAAGFAAEDINITSKEYKMVDFCTAYPECPVRHVPLLLTRLVKR